MIRSTLFRGAAGAILAVALLFPAAVTAQGSTPATNDPPPLPSARELARISPSGSYLAARHAGLNRDASAASVYYRAALRADPSDPDLLAQAFLSVLIDGDVEEAVRLAERLIAINSNHRIARLALGVRALRHKQYKTARQHLAQAVSDPITDLIGTLMIAWSTVGSGNSNAAVESIDQMTGPEWYGIFRDLHAGLIYDFIGNRREAGRRLEKAHEVDGNALRAVEAYGRWASRNLPREEALAVYAAFDKVLPRHPLVLDSMRQIREGRKLGPLVDNVQAGAAEALYGLGASLGRQGGEDLGLVFLQLAVYLQPDHALALLSLADLYETLKQPRTAIRFYERIPETSPLRRNALIQLGVNYDAIDRTDEAKRHLNEIIAKNSDDIEAIMALGNVLRGRKEFNECADVYGRGIATIAEPERPHWLIYYFRGICHERSKQWPKAEADFKQSLELYPDQPHVLNYLGYSWIDQGVNLEEGTRMIRRAVEQRPDDGYIVDSLGWAYYRTGNYEEAVKHLERAVELRPEDPIINDHLGDAYWRVGRHLEARFKWSHARDLNPEPEDLKKIEQKLKVGLTEDSPPSAGAQEPKKNGEGG